MGFELHHDLKRDGILIGRFPLCLVLLINDHSYPWFVLVPERENIRDTIDLPEADYKELWNESRAFAAAIMRIFSGEKLNIAALGNVTPQLHVHHIVRYSTDPAWNAARLRRKGGFFLGAGQFHLFVLAASALDLPGFVSSGSFS